MSMAKPIIDMKKFKCSKWSRIRIWNVNDAKIIEFALNMDQNKSVNLNKINAIPKRGNQNKHHAKNGNQNKNIVLRREIIKKENLNET
jgi:hypothetical protein